MSISQPEASRPTPPACTAPECARGIRIRSVAPALRHPFRPIGKVAPASVTLACNRRHRDNFLGKQSDRVLAVVLQACLRDSCGFMSREVHGGGYTGMPGMGVTFR